jgi:hypothetical protein
MTEQRQPENQTAAADKHLGQTALVGVRVNSEHQHRFLPLNPDYVPPALFPLLDPLKHDDYRNHTRPLNNVHSVKDKDSSTKDGPKKFLGDYKPTQPVLTKSSTMSDMIDFMHITTTKDSKVHETVDQAHKHKDVSNNEEKPKPYDVKPPLLPGYEEEPLHDSEESNVWIQPQRQGDRSKEDSAPHSEQGTPSFDNSQYGVQNYFNTGEYFIAPNRSPVPGAGEVFHVQAIPGSPEIQQQKPSAGHQINGPSDSHLQQILMHLQRQGILPEHYTILQQDTPQRQTVESPSHRGDAKKKPDKKLVSDDIQIHVPSGRIPPQYNQEYTPELVPTRGQRPSLYQTGISGPLPNDPRNILTHTLLPNPYFNQPGGQPDTDGPLVAHIPYQGLLVPHQYRGALHTPPQVDIDPLLLTSQGRHNQSLSG